MFLKLGIWYDIMFHDYLVYVTLYLAIRGGMWGSRVARLKEMCPLFAAVLYQINAVALDEVHDAFK